MKRERDLRVKENVRLNSRHFLLKLACEEGCEDIVAGQFVEVRAPQSANVLLRRPISINYVDKEKKEMWLMVQEVGSGTIELGKVKPGETVNVVYPLGNGFCPEGDTNPLIIGGGVGVAPILALASEMKAKGMKPTILLGARTKADLLERDLFEQMGDVYVTTEDGSDGDKGFVTQHSILKEKKFDAVYCCGPTPMMKAVGRWAKEEKLKCKLSLENKMACGLGACLCCVEDTKKGNVCVCAEGPVFDLEELKF